MARRTIQFDSVSLQDGSLYKTQEIQHESMDSRELNIQRLGKGDGGKLVSETFAPKTIKLIGTIFCTDCDNLESRIDTFKELLSRQEKNLDIQYASGTRRYVATCSNYLIERKHYNLTFANWEANFLISNTAFGKSLDTSTYSQDLIVVGTATVAGTYTFTGTRRPMPTIKMTVNSETDLSKVRFRNVNTNGAIEVETAFNAADVLIVNTSDYTVTLNGTAQDYAGSFPEFVAGANDFRVQLRADAANVTLKLIYYSLYL